MATMQLSKVLAASSFLLTTYCTCVGAHHFYHGAEQLSSENRVTKGRLALLARELAGEVPGTGLRTSFEERKWTEGSLQPNRKLQQAEDQDALLWETVRSGDYQAVEKLLDAGADPNYTDGKGYDVLAVAIANDYGQIITLLINRGANAGGAPSSNTEELGSLQFAAVSDAPNAARALIGAGLPVDGLNLLGFSALNHAAFEGSIRVAEVLLANGASIDVVSRDSNALTPLHSAIDGQHLLMVKLLLSKGADVNARRNSSDSPLHDAAQYNFGEMVQELINNGADLEAKTNKGSTPLFDAAFLGSRSAIEVLVLNGANKMVRVFGTSISQALCLCIELNEPLRLCHYNECDNQRSMQQLLTGD